MGLTEFGSGVVPKRGYISGVTGVAQSHAIIYMEGVRQVAVHVDPSTGVGVECQGAWLDQFQTMPTRLLGIYREARAPDGVSQ